MNKFQVYAPLQKSQDEDNSDGTLTIVGVASTTNQDLTGDIIQQSAIQSMKEQAITKNLHLDHKYGLSDGLIGTITEVLDTDDDTLAIKAKILSRFAPEIKEMLDIGINLGLSIGGYVTEYTPIKEGGWTIEQFDLMEISLTGMPANWDTFGTITTSKGIVKSKCLTGACIQSIKNMEKENMAEENNNSNNDEATGLTEDKVKEIATNLFNELMSETKESIVQETADMVKDQLENIVEEKVGEKNSSTEENNNEENGETKATNTEQEEEDKEKALSELVSKAVGEAMGGFFKQVEKNRNPQPHVDEVDPEPENKNNDMNAGTPEEIAKMFSAPTTNDIVANILDKEL